MSTEITVAERVEKVVTGTGLNLPIDCTEGEFFEVGRLLGVIETGHQWAVGDWYNNIPNGYGDKKEMCEKVGINHALAKTLALTARKYEMSIRVDGVTFGHHAALTTKMISPEEREYLLVKAKEKGWSVKEITLAKKKLLGIVAPEVPKGFDEKVDKLLEILPKSAQPKAKKAITTITNALKKDFNEAVNKVAKAKVKVEQERLQERSAELRKKEERVGKLMLKVDGLMTQEEFNLIRGCLHPDRAPSNRKEKFTSAFNVFNRLKQSIHPQSKEWS